MDDPSVRDANLIWRVVDALCTAFLKFSSTARARSRVPHVSRCRLHLRLHGIERLKHHVDVGEEFVLRLRQRVRTRCRHDRRDPLSGLNTGFSAVHSGRGCDVAAPAMAQVPLPTTPMAAKENIDSERVLHTGPIMPYRPVQTGARWHPIPASSYYLSTPLWGFGSENSGHDIDESLEVEDKLLLGHAFSRT